MDKGETSNLDFCFVLLFLLFFLDGFGGDDSGGGGAGGACDVADVNACLDLLNCCRLILTNPVFFQSCESVALLCDADRCERVLAGYKICSEIDL